MARLSRAANLLPVLERVRQLVNAGETSDAIVAALRQQLNYVTDVKGVNRLKHMLRKSGADIIPAHPTRGKSVRPRARSTSAAGLVDLSQCMVAPSRPDRLSVAQIMLRDDLRYVSTVSLAWPDALEWGRRWGVDLTSGTDAEKLARINAARAAHFLPVITITRLRAPQEPLPRADWAAREEAGCP